MRPKRKNNMAGMSVSSGDKRPTKSGAGMTAAGVAKYNRRTGGNLKTAVTGKVSREARQQVEENLTVQEVQGR